jgi:hypothetical protein
MRCGLIGALSSLFGYPWAGLGTSITYLIAKILAPKPLVCRCYYQSGVNFPRCPLAILLHAHRSDHRRYRTTEELPS